MTQLLRTKLAPPHLRASTIMREQLLARLDDGFERKLTLLSAPAGFGKTTLVASWLTNVRTFKRLNVRTFAWVSLDGGDNDPVRFWRYLITACQTFDAALGAVPLALLDAPQPHFESVLTAFINELALLADRSILVLEDYHVITARQIQEMMAFLLDHLPAALHLVMITRTDPP